MKYPQNQFEALKSAIKTLSEHLDIKVIHPAQLHGMIYREKNSGFSHNHLYITANKNINRAHAIGDVTGLTKLIASDESFECYPAGCDDTHVTTAVKRAIKELSL